MIEAGHRLLESRLIARTWGNISARISDEEFVITPSGRGYDDLKPEELVKVRISDCSWEGNIKPSSEKLVHAAAYAAREETDFIVHTHQFYASAVAAECRDTAFAPCAEYALPGTSKLKKNVEAKLLKHPESKVFLMARHGTLILSKDMDEAFELAGGLEIKSRMIVDARVSGIGSELSEEFDIEALRSEEMPFIKIAADSYIRECCSGRVRLGAFLDDYAQIAGPDLICVGNDVNMVRRALLGYRPAPAFPTVSGGRVIMPMTGALGRMGTHPALNTMIGRNAVLVKGVGAVCTGRTEEDAEAAAMIVSKNCAAACYVKTAKPLGALDSRLQRYTYLAKYSKQKELNR